MRGGWGLRSGYHSIWGLARERRAGLVGNRTCWMRDDDAARLCCTGQDHGDGQLSVGIWQRAGYTITDVVCAVGLLGFVVLVVIYAGVRGRLTETSGVTLVDSTGGDNGLLGEFPDGEASGRRLGTEAIATRGEATGREFVIGVKELDESVSCAEGYVGGQLVREVELGGDGEGQKVPCE